MQLFATPWTIVHGILQARILEWVAFPFSRGFSQLRDRTPVSCIAGGFFASWATGKPKNTGVSSLSLLQRIFLSQESNQGLLHCRQILYQLSYQFSSIRWNLSDLLWSRGSSYESWRWSIFVKTSEYSNSKCLNSFIKAQTITMWQIKKLGYKNYD